LELHDVILEVSDDLFHERQIMEHSSYIDEDGLKNMLVHARLCESMIEKIELILYQFHMNQEL